MTEIVDTSANVPGIAKTLSALIVSLLDYSRSATVHTLQKNYRVFGGIYTKE